MDTFNGKEKINIRLHICFLVGLIFIFTITMISDFNRQTFARAKKTEEKDESKLNVLNLHGRELGLVDTDGNVFNRYGKLLGSVNTKKGIVFMTTLQ